MYNHINIELTSRCNKSCWMCGRRKVEQESAGDISDSGDMDFSLVKRIADQLPADIFVHLHNNGEPLLYPRFWDAVKLFKKQYTHVTTNGKLLMKKGVEIIENLDTMAISIIQDDPEADEQYDLICDFMRMKGRLKPHVVLRFLGNVDTKRYDRFNATRVTRVLHDPMGSFRYERNPGVPETGVCQDFLHHPAIDRHGYMSICVRFDHQRIGVLGNVKDETIKEMWNGVKRKRWLGFHLKGRRALIPLCSHCDYWGIPIGR